MSEQPSFLVKGLEKLLDQIDRETERLERLRENLRVSEGLRQEIEQKIVGLRNTRVEITALVSRLERL